MPPAAGPSVERALLRFFLERPSNDLLRSSGAVTIRDFAAFIMADAACTRRSRAIMSRLGSFVHPDWSLGFDRLALARTCRAAASASAGSLFGRPGLRLGLPGTITSYTQYPSSRSLRVKPAPYEPVPSMLLMPILIAPSAPTHDADGTNAVAPTAPTYFRQSHQRGYALPAQQNRQEGARLEERNIMGELNMYRQLGLKPNFSEIGRRYGLDRHTVARYWNEGGDVDDGRCNRPSGFDAHSALIAEKAAMPGATKKAVHEYLLHRCGGRRMPGYNAFTHYCRRHDIAFDGGGRPEPHPRYETPPGRQLQFDWKEDLRMTSRRGEAFEFNVFSATLGCSRMHRFVYSKGRTRDELLSCWLAAISFYGGVPEEWVTDNMSAIVTFDGRRRVKSDRVLRFAREAGFELCLCKPGTPETKGKDESANRFLNRLSVYDGDFEDEADLVGIIAHIEARSNAEPNETTGLPPAALFMREKEYLRPVGNMGLLEQMVGDVRTQVVPSTMLVRAAGREWSVPRRCIGRKAKVIVMPGGQIRVTVAGELVAVHDASQGAGRFNYTEGHYAEALEGKARYSDSDIEEAARENLRLLDGMGGLDG